MMRLKYNKASFLTALIFSFTAVLLQFLLLAFVFKLAFASYGLILLLEFFGFFIGAYLILSYTLERFLFSRVKELYASVIPTTSYVSTISQFTDIDLLTSNLKKLNSDKNLEIDLLKKEQAYRREFIGNIAHELKTPLFMIEGYVLTLLEGGVEDKKTIKKYLSQTAKGIDRLNFVIKDLDLVTKFESGMAKLNWTSFNIIETIKNVFELVARQAQERKISLKMDKVYNKPIQVYADEERIQQVLTNLIINSLKYGIERGTTEVGVEILKENKILVRITDNGEGINEEHLPRLFERFYRVDKTRNRNQGGSGLGLAIVKHIIEAHHEKIFVESEARVGSEFSFSLTLDQKSAL